jgi:xylosylprotein 4-beta-galactosyltransferase
MLSRQALPHHHLAVLVPYRSVDGTVHIDDLSMLCDRLGRHFTRQRLSYELFIINQVDNLPFNRGALTNAAVATLLARTPDVGAKGLAARHHAAFDYLAVHDVDRFPVEDVGNRSAHEGIATGEVRVGSSKSSGAQCDLTTRTYYAFPPGQPRVLHPMSFAGGVLVLSLAQYLAVNGFSNAYWGWGEEDNDLFLRLRWCGFAPVHGDRLDECMEHKDCEACKRQKRQLDAGALETHERRMRTRLSDPRRYMVKDGLSASNFTLRHRRAGARHPWCGQDRAVRATILDVELRRRAPRPSARHH